MPVMTQAIRGCDERQLFAITSIAYSIAGVLLLPLYRYQINPDGISYISVARHYLAGDFAHAINGYWSPLLSWLLIPIVPFIPPLVASKLITLASGLGVLFGIRRLAGRFDIDRRVLPFLYASAAIFLLYAALVALNPDLLIAAFLVWYCAVVFDRQYTARIVHGALAGALGGLAFYAKQYALPFFAVHFAVMSAGAIWTAGKEQRRRAVLMALAGAGVFLVMTVPWVAIISAKYGHLTIGEASRYALWLKGPGVDHPMHTRGFLPPPHDRAISVWEDISFTELPDRNVSSPWETLQYELQLLWTRIRQATRTFSRVFSYLSIPIVLLYVIHGIRATIRSNDPIALIAAFTIAAYTGGYLFLFVIERYLWFVNPIVMLMGFSLISSYVVRTRGPWLAVAALVALSFIVTPAYRLVTRAFLNRDTYLTAQALRPYLPAGTRVGSNTEWHKTLAIAYHLDLQYYGEASPNDGPDARLASLTKYGVTYYIVWDEQRAEREAFARLPEVTHGGVSGAKIYLVMCSVPQYGPVR